MSLRDSIYRFFWAVGVPLHVFLYRLTGGRIGGRAGKVPMLLLDHVGRRTGRQRTNPLLYLEDGEDLVIVASKGGFPTHPAWWLNLRARPEATVQVGGERRTVVARQASPAEKARLWPRLVAIWPDYDAYQRRTTREIPVVILTPARR